MRPLIAIPSLHENYIACRGFNTIIKLPDNAFAWLQQGGQAGQSFTKQFIDLFQKTWNLDVSGTLISNAMQFRDRPVMAYTSASYELNLLCDYQCEHCYLDTKINEGLDMAMRKKVLELMCQAGVIRLQITGGEPFIDRNFADTYRLANELGLLVRISSNGSQLYRQNILNLLAELPPTSLTISLYGAKQESYEGLTQTVGRGTFKKFMHGLEAAAEAKLPVRLSIVITKHNETELSSMIALADKFGFEHYIYNRLCATINGNGHILANQAKEVDLSVKRPPFAGCEAGKAFFHVNPLGQASVCKISREASVNLITDGLDGLRQIAKAADNLLQRDGACVGCTLSGMCGTCPLMVRQYRKAGANKTFFCQHDN